MHRYAYPPLVIALALISMGQAPPTLTEQVLVRQNRQGTVISSSIDLPLADSGYTHVRAVTDMPLADLQDPNTDLLLELWEWDDTIQDWKFAARGHYIGGIHPGPGGGPQQQPSIGMSIDESGIMPGRRVQIRLDIRSPIRTGARLIVR